MSDIVNEAVERVAKAILDAGFKVPAHDIARAAIAAMPEPSHAELEDASTACIELAAKHGFATGHGDTVADMIREFSAQIPPRTGI